jgi:hypothetical protein
MDGSSRNDWKKWGHWLLWWKIDPAELQGQLAGYETLGIRSARGFGFLLATIAAAVSLFLAAQSVTPYHNELTPRAYILVATALGYLVLGFLLLRGNRRAIFGLMIWSTSDTLYSISMCSLYYPHRESIPFFLLSSVVGWAIYMHVFYLAIRVERERKVVA